MSACEAPRPAARPLPAPRPGLTAAPDQRTSLPELGPHSTIVFLVTEVGLTKEQCCEALRREPSFLWRAPATLEASLGFLQGVLGMSPAQVREAVVAFPNLMRYTPESMQAKVEVLQRFQDDSVGEGFVAGAVAQMPFLLSLSRTNLEQKLTLFVEELGWDLAGALKPRFMRYSVQQRLRPRLGFARLRKYDLVANHGKRWVDVTDRVFAEEMVGSSLEEYSQFLALYIRRAKDAGLSG